MKPHDPVHDLSRRPFLARALAAAGGLGAAGLSSCAGSREASAGPRAARSDPLIEPGDVVLFQGDSITDAGRERASEGQANHAPALGGGYAFLAAAGLMVRQPGCGVRVHNRGISGNKVHQLAARWQADALELEPDVLSILIGVNDIWHTRGGGYEGTVAIYERDYDALLGRTRDALPDVKLVVCEPFVLRCGAIDETWFPEFDEYRAAARRVSEGHGATWVPFQETFERAARFAEPKTWAGDGVHPSSAGAALMAQTWLDAVGAGA